MGNAFWRQMGTNAMNSGAGGMDPMGSGTAQGGPGMPDPGGTPLPPKQPGQKINPPLPPPVAAQSANFGFQQQGDIQNNFSTTNQYQARYGVPSAHF